MGKLEVLLSDPWKSDKPQHHGHQLQIQAEIAQEGPHYRTTFLVVDLDRGGREVARALMDRTLTREDAEMLTHARAAEMHHPITQTRPTVEFEGAVIEANPPALRLGMPPASDPWWAMPGRQAPDQPIPGVRPPVPVTDEPELPLLAGLGYALASRFRQIGRDLSDRAALPAPRAEEAPPPAPGTAEVEAVVVSDAVGVAAWATHHRATPVKSLEDLIARVQEDAGGGDVSRLVIIDHGSTKGIQIGENDFLNLSNLDLYEPQLKTLSAYLDRDTGYVFFQGCQVGHNLQLLSRISTILKVPVFGGTGYTNPVYRANPGVYVRCDPDGECATNVKSPPHSTQGTPR